MDHKQSSEFWSLENGYATDNVTTYPRRVLGPSPAAGLSVLFVMEENDLDYLCSGADQGFKVILHPPGDIPSVSKFYFRVPIGQEAVVSVKPIMITSSQGLEKYKPETRQCLLNKEGRLKFFKVYTQNNCQLECFAAFTLSMTI